MKEETTFVARWSAPYGRVGLDGDGLEPTLVPYVSAVSPEIGRRWRPAVVVCPGGAYANLSDREADCVALRYQAFGMQSFVLRYSVGGRRHPTALLELAAAVAHIRANAEALDVDPQRILVCGFSAGGHLAANLGTDWHLPWLADAFGDPEAIRPNGLILGYPVITSGALTHGETISQLLGRAPTPKQRERVSLELRVTDRTPPAFLWHAADDQAVPAANSLLFAQALLAQGTACELHIFPSGGHGLSLADTCSAAAENQINDDCAQWFGLSLRWIGSLP